MPNIVSCNLVAVVVIVIIIIIIIIIIIFERVLAKGKNNDFRIPTWIKTLNEPSYNFNLDPLSYREFTKVIMKMKCGASLCPLNQISVIPFRKFPYLRTFFVGDHFICVDQS